MNIEDRMSMWAAKRPREEPAELMLEGAQEIADLRRAREEDGKQMSALIEGYQKMQALCIDGKYLTDSETKSLDIACMNLMETVRRGKEKGHGPQTTGPLDAARVTIRSLLERFA